MREIMESIALKHHMKIDNKASEKQVLVCSLLNVGSAYLIWYLSSLMLVSFIHVTWNALCG